MPGLPPGRRFRAHDGEMMGSPLENVLSLKVAGFGSVSLAVQLRRAASEVPVLLVHGFASNAVELGGHRLVDRSATRRHHERHR